MGGCGATGPGWGAVGEAGVGNGVWIWADTEVVKRSVSTAAIIGFMGFAFVSW
jgi:hypothetical protein